MLDKEEIMDIDEPSDHLTKEKEEPAALKSDDFKYKLLDRLFSPDADTTKSLTLAITIQTMFSKDLEVLERLFNFFIQKNQLEMALDLWENTLLKKFNLSPINVFDLHLTKIATQIIYHLNVKAMSHREKNQKTKIDINQTDEFYLQLFLKLSQPSQEKLATQLLDKYRMGFSFLRINMPDATKKDQPVTQQTIDIREFYTKLIEVKDTIFLTKNLLAIYRKFIPEYGLFLIDGFLNIEKQLFTNLIQNSTNLPKQTDQILNNIERRSLNVIRRICVVDLIPEFIYLIEKLDNRHCYRWIEKSLEFFTKYTLNSIEAKTEMVKVDGVMTSVVKLDYNSMRLLNDYELSIANESEDSFKERIEFLNQNLKELVDYKYNLQEGTVDNSPFLHVYQLLDEIGKKLDWPPIPANLQNTSFAEADTKLSYLLNLKSKAMDNKSISVSSLNKQISFYGIALFFHKLIEFNAISAKYFSSNLVLTRRLDLIIKSQFLESLTPQNLSDSYNEPIDFAICTLVFSLKLWQKFNSHKEFSTIVTKCLSNSKLDSLSCYKNFIIEYYNVYAATLNPAISPPTWESLNELLTVKQKIPILINLFVTERTSFNKFFSEMVSLISQVNEAPSLDIQPSFGNIILSNNQFDIFELNKQNALEHFSKLIIEKLYQLFAIKKTNLICYLSENDILLGHLIIIIQINLSEDAPDYILELYDIIFQIIKSKNSFRYPDFHDYAYDIQVLQDFLTLINASGATEPNKQWKFTKKTIESMDELANLFYSQVNSGMSDQKYQTLEKFYSTNSESLAEYFNTMFSI